LYPGYTLQTQVKESRRWNTPEDQIERNLDGLRKAGLEE